MSGEKTHAELLRTDALYRELVTTLRIVARDDDLTSAGVALAAVGAKHPVASCILRRRRGLRDSSDPPRC